MISPQTGITWFQGETMLVRYKVPELDAVLIPAGSLDTPPPISQQGRIFWDSRVPWSCKDDLPVYSEYPAGA